VSDRVAVHPGATTTRVAVADPQPRLVAELPGHVSPDVAVALLFGRPVTPTVVGPGGVPAAVAVGGAPRRVVVEVSSVRVEVSVVDGGRVVATGTPARVAGADPATRVVDAVVALAREHAVEEVVLVGPDPGLATLLDAADVSAVQVPATAAVLGAAASAEQGPSGSGVDAVPTLLPEPRSRRSLVVLAGVLLVALGVAATLLPPAQAARTGSPGQLVQYGYRFTLPDGWAHTGALPERRRTVVTPAAAPDGIELVAVERADLGYDGGLEPARAAADLRVVYDRALAAGERLAGFAAGRAGGRDVHTYGQPLADGATVDWTVVFDGTAQLSVGCRHGPVPSPALTTACERVVASVTRA
jgi:type VII secretion-associated protein (TIGR03931 family)